MAKCVKNKIAVKLALSAKYERLAALAGSTPKRRAFQFHADRFRNQARAIERAHEHAQSVK